MRPALVLAWMWFWLVLPRLAPAQTLPLRRYSLAEGLPQSTVYSLAQDGLGQLWAGTQSGACWFDGREFQTLDRHQGLPDNQVMALAADPATGALWLGHRYGAVSVRRADGRVQVLRPRGFRPRGRVRQLLPQGPRTLWVAMVEEGLYCLRWQGADTLVRHFGAGAGLPADSVTQLCAGPAGQLWAATTGGLAVFGADAGGPVAAPGLPAALARQPLSAVCRAADQRYWLGTPAGLLLLSRPAPGQAWQLSRRTTAHGLCANRVERVLEDRLGRVWALTNLGVSRAETPASRFTCFEDNSQMRDVARDVLEDREGNVWLVQDDGLAQVPPDERFTLFTRRDGLPDNMVLALAQLGPAEYWLCTKAGLAVYRPDQPAGRRFAPGHRRPGGAAANFVRCLLRDRRGRVWVGSRGGGVAFFDPATSRWQELDGVPGIAQQHVLSLAEDARGRIWVGTFGAGATVYDPATGAARTFGPGTGLLGSSRVWALLRDGRGRLWLGTDESGLLLADTDRDTFRRADDRPGRLSINSIAEDGRGRLWLSSIGEGLLRLEGRHLRAFGPEVGLRATTSYFVRADGRGHLWVGTNRGVDDFDPARGRTVSYGLNEGFLGQETNLNAALLDDQGRLWVGTVKGLMCHDARRARPNRVPPHTRFTGLQVLAHDTVLRPGLRLPHDRNQLTYKFVGISLTNPGQVRYRHRLAGFEDAWQPATARPEATYTNLPPGRYTLLVRAANNDGVWGPPAAAPALTIRPAWWQTWWFRGALALLLLGLGILAYRLRVNHLLALERVRLGIARDLHDDMGSTLSSISILSQLARKHQAHGRPAQAATTLVQIGESAVHMLDAMDDIVWAINPHHDGLPGVVARMRAFAAETLEPLGVSLHFAIGSGVAGLRLPMHARREFYLLFKEAIHNLAKYAQARHTEISLRYERPHLQLFIEDDGVGFDPAAPAQGSGNGLPNMQQRARTLRGTLHISSAPSQGTKLKLTIPVA